MYLECNLKLEKNLGGLQKNDYKILVGSTNINNTKIVVCFSSFELYVFLCIFIVSAKIKTIEPW